MFPLCIQTNGWNIRVQGGLKVQIHNWLSQDNANRGEMRTTRNLSTSNHGIMLMNWDDPEWVQLNRVVKTKYGKIKYISLFILNFDCDLIESFYKPWLYDVQSNYPALLTARGYRPFSICLCMDSNVL
ncbi:hypothetical protein TNCT_244601 [Trichonephila clavata]|uniref:Uncharacterized protein n=1 Tax=Trichonephila clavata TaxID=2740835 RepID=A0A8X6HV00_TRICU|nr:hypothetical protein TNCT_244601 [Trichonephila clavata]